MAGIAGIVQSNSNNTIADMLAGISHRGKDHHKTIQRGGVTLASVWNNIESGMAPRPLRKHAVWDGISVPLPDVQSLSGHKFPFAVASVTADGWLLARDRLGVKPLYYGWVNGTLAFASEVKSLLAITRDVNELPPGSVYSSREGLKRFTGDSIPDLTDRDYGEIARTLRLKLEQAVIRRVVKDEMGSWLSGGLDSSAISAILKPYVRRLHSFVSGVEGASDLDHGRQIAEYLGTEHHELVVGPEDLLEALPQVIFHLESFDALLVRSSITNYLTAKMASNYVDTVFSGEGGDELFAGYSYLKQLPENKIADELVDITARLHNTALQRVDRCAQAHGLSALVPFADPDVLDYAQKIPARYKMYIEKDKKIEKWILRKAVEDILPEAVLWRPKAKFWEGAGVANLLEQHAETRISDRDFQSERQLPNGWRLNSKEELFYYRIFKEHFGELENLEWMGRTKGAPVQV